MDPRWLQLVHEVPGRVRFRAPWLREQRPDAERLADALASLPGMREVRAHPYTGSVLCSFEPEALDSQRILAAAQQATGVSLVLARGEKPPASERVDTGSNGVARALATLFRELNEEVLRVTEGKLDLGTAATLGFVSAGAFEVALKGKMPAPPWFNLAWWGFRTFTTFEKQAIEESRIDPVAHA